MEGGRVKKGGGWILIVTPEWKATVEFDGRGRIYKTDPQVTWANRRHVDHVKEYLAGKDKLLNWEQYGSFK